MLDKLYGNGFGGNAYTDHGRAREPEIARWVAAQARHRTLGEAVPRAANRRHLATPDGVGRTATDVAARRDQDHEEGWTRIPRSYLRQVWWQQYVLGAERTLVVWEQHVDFVPVPTSPSARWVDRDDDEIHRLVSLADKVLDRLRSAR